MCCKSFLDPLLYILVKSSYIICAYSKPWASAIFYCLFPFKVLGEAFTGNRLQSPQRFHIDHMEPKYLPVHSIKLMQVRLYPMGKVMPCYVSSCIVLILLFQGKYYIMFISHTYIISVGMCCIFQGHFRWTWGNVQWE